MFCCAHADQIKKYLSESKWQSPTGNSKQMKVITVVSTNCTSPGEALRIIDQKDVIKGDFILVSGETISNLNLAPVLEAHRARRAVDKDAIMTLVMKAAHHPHQRLRLGDAEVLTCIDSSTQRLLKYQETEGGGGGKANGMVKMDAAFFSERDTVQVRADLLDTQISICAPEVLMLFSDNFDYANVKRDFVSGVLSEEELGNKLYVHELSNEYCGFVHNLRSYDAISRDILQRWTFPFVPDTNLLHRGGGGASSSYGYTRNHVYAEQQVQMRGFKIGCDVCIGNNTAIGEGSRISQSVIGRNCRIGKNVTILGSYLQDNVVVLDNAVLTNAMVCESAVLRQSVVVEPGAIVSFNVVIGQGHVVRGDTRISLCQQRKGQLHDSDDELEYSPPPDADSAIQPQQSAPARRHNNSSGRDNDEDEDEGDEEEDLGLSLSKSVEKPSAQAIRASDLARLGRLSNREEKSKGGDGDLAAFDEAVVGLGGVGYEWHPNEGDIGRYSLAAPPLATLTLVESNMDLSTEGGGADRTRGDDDDESEGESVWL